MMHEDRIFGVGVLNDVRMRWYSAARIIWKSDG